MKTKIKSYGTRADKSMRTWIQLLRLHHLIVAKELRYFSDHNLTLNQFKVLEVLYHRGDLNVGTITKLTISTPGNITVVVRNLLRDGLIYKITNEKDKRISLLSISPNGKQIIDDIFPTHAKNLTNSFEVLSDDELDSLFSMLRKLQKSQ